MRDLRELLGEGLDLPPIGGVTYRVAPPTGRVGIRLQAMRDASSMLAAGVELSKADRRRLKLDDAAEVDFYQDTLGPTYERMLDDDCTSLEIRIAASCAYLYFTAADAVDGARDVETFLADQDPRRAAADQQTPTPPTSQTHGVTESEPTAAASTTKVPSSGSGTTSRKASPPKAAKGTGRALRSAS